MTWKRRHTGKKATWLLLASLIALLVVNASPASASKGVVKFFGGGGSEGGQFSDIQGIAINQSGAGGASPGDLYAADPGNSRVQQFSASGHFVRAFGLNVGGSGVDVCTEAASCSAGTESGVAGGLVAPTGIAIDQATGIVYVVDAQNNRINAFSAIGEFEGAFGWSTRADAPAPELQFCTVVTGCQKGTEGAAAGQLPGRQEGNQPPGAYVSPLNGHLLVTNSQNRRVDEYSPVISGEKVTGASFVHGFGWGAVNGAEEFQICTTTCAPGQFFAGCSEKPIHDGEFSGAEGLRDVVVNANGQVLVGDERYGRISTFSSEGAFLGTILSPISKVSCNVHMTQMSLNPVSENLLAFGNLKPGSGSELRELTPTGEVLESFDPGFDQVTSMAVNGSSGTIYFSLFTGEGNAGVVVIGETVPPTASIEAPTEVGGTTATFHGKVNPTGFFTSFEFETSVDGSNWEKAKDKQEEEEISKKERSRELPADEAEHTVSQKAEGLEALTDYHVRLVATKKFNSGTASAETTFTTGPAKPIATKPVVADISDVTVKLEAEVNPENETTSYGFQCVTKTNFEASEWAEAIEMPLGGGSIPPKGEPVKVTEEFAGLIPATPYRCRLLAANGTGSVISETIATATYESGATGLPDGRAYEQVTPVQKNGADARGAKFLVKAAPDGSAISYYIPGGGGLGEGSQEFPTYYGSRIGGDWQSYGFLPPASLGSRAIVSGWSEDLRYAYVLAWEGGSSATFYRYDTITGTARPIASGLSPKDVHQLFSGESATGSLVLFESRTALTEEAVEGANNLYAWDADSGAISLVSVLPDGSPSPTGAFLGAYNWMGLNAKEGGAGVEMYMQALHAVSNDGQKAFFTTSAIGQLYMREGIAGPSPSTVQVSASQKTNGSGSGGKDPHGPGKAAFMEATPDGRYVFFTSPVELTNDATTGSADQGNDLYRFDTETGALIDLAPDLTDSNGADVQGLLGASADGSYAYFVANGALAGGASQGNCTDSAITGFNGSENQRCNVYLWHEGTIELVSQIRGGDRSSGDAPNWIAIGNLGAGEASARTAAVSGDSLLFTSALSLTGYDNAGLTEVYRFDPTEGLQCVSCNPTGATAAQAASLQSIKSGFGKPIYPQPFAVSNLVDEGRRVFFDTEEKLVSTDINGVNDVYEWEANGTGSCTSSSQSDGCLYLVSTGESGEPSYFADASESGDDAFFFTRQSLVRQDTDQLQDVYDARVGGGIPSQNATPTPPCEGEACKGSAPPAAASQSAGSATFSGSGNPQPSRSHHKKKRHAKKHHKKSHHKKASKRNAKAAR